MAKYRAIVSIEFDDDDVAEFTKAINLPVDSLDVQTIIDGELDNMAIGNGFIEQFYVDGSPRMRRLSNGMLVEINLHE